MARIRTIKPELGAHEGMFDAEMETGLPMRFAWCMLFTVADRDGRFAWRPRTLKAQILPHDNVDFSRVLDAWLTRAFIVKYRVNGEWFGCIPTFAKHQVINNRESPSGIPGPDEADQVIDSRNKDIDASTTRDARDDDASITRAVHAQGEGKEGRKGKEGKGNSASAEAHAVPGLNAEAFDRWTAYRSERKPAIKPASMKAAAEELAKLGSAEQQAIAVQHSIANGYQGLFPPKAGNGALHVTASKPLKLRTADEIEAEERARGDYDAQH